MGRGCSWSPLSPAPKRCPRDLGAQWVVFTWLVRDDFLEWVAYSIVDCAAKFTVCAGFSGYSKEGGALKSKAHVKSFVGVAHPPIGQALVFRKDGFLQEGGVVRFLPLAGLYDARYVISEQGRYSAHARARRRNFPTNGRLANNSLRSSVQVTLNVPFLNRSRRAGFAFFEAPRAQRS